MIAADHLLHVTLTSEGYWRYRLECLSGEFEHIGYTEKPDGLNDTCWVHDWLDGLGGGCIHGDDWPEDGAPYPVSCGYDEGLVVRYAPPAEVEL